MRSLIIALFIFITFTTHAQINVTTQLKPGATTSTLQVLMMDTVSASPTFGRVVYKDLSTEVYRLTNAMGFAKNITGVGAITVTPSGNNYTVSVASATASTPGVLRDSFAFRELVLTGSASVVLTGGTGGYVGRTLTSPDQTMSFNPATGVLSLTNNNGATTNITIPGTLSGESSIITLTNNQTSVPFTGISGYTKYELFRDGVLQTTGNFTVSESGGNRTYTLTIPGQAGERVWLAYYK